ncbi:MAG: nitrate reductase molybdenum cofactor assembly chaperone [Gemmatimonadota bacterium]
MNSGFRALAALLDYPSAELLAHLGEIESAATALDESSSGAVMPLLAHLRGSDLLDLQEAYIETFDRGRRTSLNLFEHVHGDSRDRGQAMVDLLAMYRSAGLELDTEQLPDYLPAFLEYLSLLESAAARDQLAEIAHILQVIRAALVRRGSTYVDIFDVLLALAGEATDSAELDEEDDTTPAAIDAAWVDAPVNFLDAPAPCGSSRTQPQEQAIHIHRRAA